MYDVLEFFRNIQTAFSSNAEAYALAVEVRIYYCISMTVLLKAMLLN